MGNFIIVTILAVMIFMVIRSSIKHFKGERGCCCGSTAVKKKNLKKKQAVVSLEKDVSDEQIRTAIEKAGYKVAELR